MIARLTGTVVGSGKDSIVLLVGGVGFQVVAPHSLRDRLRGSGQEVTLFTHLHVRENELTLYGLESEEELDLFRLFLGVSGIGPKVALSLLSHLAPDRLRAAIAQEDVAALSRVPGIGPKTAKKLVFDLKDKVTFDVPLGAPASALTEADADLIAALTGLGYSLAETQEAIRHLPREPLTLEEKVRLALAYFVS